MISPSGPPGEMRNSAQAVFDFQTVAVVVVLLAVAYLFAQIALQAGLPPAAAIVLVGIAAAGMLPHDLQIRLTPEALAVFLPALIFEAAWGINPQALKRTAWAILVLAVPGVLFTAGVIAAAGTFGGGLAVPAALALGAILAATDPVAVLALFRKLAVPTDLLTIVEGESIANDGVAAVLSQAVVAGAAAGETSIRVAPALLSFAYVCGAGIAIGLALAALATPVLRRFKTPWIGIVVTLAVAYGSYSLAALAGASGILASAAAGAALPTFAFDKDEVRSIARFWDGTAFVANAVVFLLVGLSLRLDRVFGEPRLFAAVVVAVIVSRAILAYVFVPLRGAAGLRPGWRHAIALAGVRGGLSLALALGLPKTFPDRAAVLDAVFAVVFLTIVIQGWTLAPLLRRVDLRERTARVRPSQSTPAP